MHEMVIKVLTLWSQRDILVTVKQITTFPLAKASTRITVKRLTKTRPRPDQSPFTSSDLINKRMTLSGYQLSRPQRRVALACNWNYRESQAEHSQALDLMSVI